MAEHTHEHDGRQVMVCKHVIEDHAALGMLWLDDGLVLAALCLPCGREVNNDNPEAPPPDTIRNFCADCARRDGLPVEMKGQDGFYERDGGQWVRQPEDGEMMN